MKSILIFVLSALCWQARAQESSGMVQEGRFWEMQVGMLTDNVRAYHIEGDTVIAGKEWKKVYTACDYRFPPADELFSQLTGGSVKYSWNYSYYAAVREEGDKVYAVARGNRRPRLLYDFSLKKGDIVMCGMEGGMFPCLRDTGESADSLFGFPLRTRLGVTRVDTLSFGGRDFRRITLNVYGQCAFDVYASVVWVKGVGSDCGPFTPWMTFDAKDRFRLDCREGEEGEALFKSAAFYDANEKYGTASDVNHDGQVDVADIATIITVMAGQKHE